MKCPECDLEIVLTWRRYLSAPFGRFRCPGCSTKFKLKRPLWYWLLPITQGVITFLGGVVIIAYMAGDPGLGKYAIPAVIALTISIIIVFMVIDKAVDKKFETVKA